MSNNLTAILTTTINVPVFIENIILNIKKFNHNTQNVLFLVVTDKKTPIDAKKYCQNISAKYKLDIIYLDIEAQRLFFQKNYYKLLRLFPYNDAIRRLLGSIYLLKKFPKMKRLIFIDDDNFVDKNIDFLKGHLLVGKVIKKNVVSSKNKWPNLYQFLKMDESLPLFPRGFPWKFRNKDSYKLSFKKNKPSKVVANCGFILGDPDIDAISRIFWKINVKKINYKSNFFLAKNNFFPFNDQNTCIDRKLINIYFKPLSAGRNSDIWTSYLIEKISHFYSDLVSYGKPHLIQIRNTHDNWKDFDLEKEHNLSTDLFVSILSVLKIKKGVNYFDTFNKMIKMLLIQTSFEIKERLKNKNKNKNKIYSSRHYQGFSSLEFDNRSISSLRYIQKYFQEYVRWLNLIKFYKIY